MNGEKGEGVSLTERYHIRGYPTMVFVDKEGNEIDRIIGYRPPEDFLKELKRIHRNEFTIADIQKRIQDTPNNTDLWVALGDKYSQREDLTLALEVWQTIRDLGGKEVPKAEYQIAYFNARIHQDATELTDFISQNPHSEYLDEAYRNVLQIHRSAKDRSAEIQTYRDYLDAMDLRGELTPAILNGYAWRMSELEENLTDALIRIKQAVDMAADEDSKKRTMILDTEAEVLWKLNRIEEAVEVIDRCIELQPENEYYLKQKVKFQRG